VRDVGFVIELVYGVLWMCGLYDVVLSVCVDCPLVELDDVLLDVLWFGVY